MMAPAPEMIPPVLALDRRGEPGEKAKIDLKWKRKIGFLFFSNKKTWCFTLFYSFYHKNLLKATES